MMARLWTCYPVNSVAACPLESKPAKELRGRWLSDLPLRGGLGEWIPQYVGVVYQCRVSMWWSPPSLLRGSLLCRALWKTGVDEEGSGREARKDYETQTVGSRAVHPIQSGINDPTWELKYLFTPPHSLLFLHRYQNKELGELHLR